MSQNTTNHPIHRLAAKRTTIAILAAVFVLSLTLTVFSSAAFSGEPYTSTSWVITETAAKRTQQGDCLISPFEPVCRELVANTSGGTQVPLGYFDCFPQ